MRRLAAARCVAVLSAAVMTMSACSVLETSEDSGPSGSEPGRLDGGLLDRAPDRPVEPAREQTEAGAIAFAGYVFEVFDYAYAEANPDLIDKIADLDTCLACEQPLADTTAAQQDGRVLIVPTPTLTSDAELVDETGDRSTVRLTLQQPDLVSLDADTGEPTGDNVTGLDGPFLVTLRWDAPQWTLVDFAPVGN